MYENIVPPWLPYPRFIVYTTGIIEIFFGLLIHVKLIRNFIAWCIIVFLVLIFPANVQMLLNYNETDHPLEWIALARLPLQLLLIWWAYTFTKMSSKKSSV
jgi:uncharacterized membrane protein